MEKIQMDMISQEKIVFPSFAALGARILANESLPLKRRKDVDSALSSLAKGLGIDPEVLLADPAILRTALKDFTLALAGLKPMNLRNIPSRTRFAMIQAGLITVPGRYSHARRQPGPHCSPVLGMTPKATSASSPASAAIVA
jgi:hypothetical protein